jgi:hypothetical protein
MTVGVWWKVKVEKFRFLYEKNNCGRPYQMPKPTPALMTGCP